MLKKDFKKNFYWRFSAKIIALFGLILIIAISYPLSKIINQHYKINKEIKELETEIKNMENKNNSLNKLIKFIGSDEFTDKQARLNLNYKKEGEEVVVIKNKDRMQNEKKDPALSAVTYQADNYEQENLSFTSNINKWWRYFIK